MDIDDDGNEDSKSFSNKGGQLSLPSSSVRVMIPIGINPSPKNHSFLNSREQTAGDNAFLSAERVSRNGRSGDRNDIKFPITIRKSSTG
ncbi:hypothetical protein TNCT_216281 [Trichonephila clavata]|uniref:Uncharacterized protein n=1 Tax=Trichonephila clavata TaxID=2740835 RepID=A0A8X6HJG9_TRICU|nr:hypothetical protein TNCT_216281 [Trichonephila clavata]